MTNELKRVDYSEGYGDFTVSGVMWDRLSQRNSYIKIINKKKIYVALSGNIEEEKRGEYGIRVSAINNSILIAELQVLSCQMRSKGTILYPSPRCIVYKNGDVKINHHICEVDHYFIEGYLSVIDYPNFVEFTDD